MVSLASMSVEMSAKRTPAGETPAGVFGEGTLQENDTTPKEFIDVPPVALDGSFWTLFKWARGLDLNTTRRAVLWAVLGHVDWRTGQDCKASLETLAQESGAARMTVFRALQWLEGQGVILGKHTGGRYVTSYQIVRFEPYQSDTVGQKQQYQSETVNRITEDANHTTESIEPYQSDTQTNPGSILNQPSPISGASADAEGGEGIKNSQVPENAEPETLAKDERVTTIAGRQILVKEQPPLLPVCPGCKTRKMLNTSGYCGHCFKNGKHLKTTPPGAPPCEVGDCPEPSWWVGLCFDHAIEECAAVLNWDILTKAKDHYRGHLDLFAADMDHHAAKLESKEKRKRQAARRLQEYEGE